MKPWPLTLTARSAAATKANLTRNWIFEYLSAEQNFNFASNFASRVTPEDFLYETFRQLGTNTALHFANCFCFFTSNCNFTGLFKIIHKCFYFKLVWHQIWIVSGFDFCYFKSDCSKLWERSILARKRTQLEWAIASTIIHVEYVDV